MVNVSNKFEMLTFAVDSISKDGITIPGIKRMYDIALATGDSIMVHGSFGIGKSEAVRQWNAQKVEEYNKRIAAGENVKPWNPHITDVRLSMTEPVDLLGVPTVLTKEDGTKETKWAVPNVWPKDTGEFSGGVIHLDEFNQAPAAVLNAAFQLVLDRRLGDYKVPDNYLIIASCNPACFNSTVTDISMPLANRFSHFNLTANFDSWLNYRINNGGNLDVMTFLKTQDPAMFYDTQSINRRIGEDTEQLFTDICITPRSWETVEKVLSLPDGDESNGGFTIDEKQRYCTGRLGIAETAKLFNYIKDKSRYQSWKDILVEGNDFKTESNLEQYFAVQLACLSAIATEKSETVIRKYVLNFIKATRNLKSKQYKVQNVSQLSKIPKIAANYKLFNAMEDCRDIVSMAASILRN